MNCNGGICQLREVFGISLSNDFLMKHVDTGFTIRVNAKSGHDNLFTVTSSYLRGYLEAIK